ncbi:hypothetical protein [Maritalea sp.]|uniref:hypothetical protein n=1 Tax=Maritalea sp. TaxID=2003361 RepID=UPI003EF62014
MRSWVALVKREFLEHRGAFLFAPAIITLVVTIVLAVSVIFNQTGIAAETEMPLGLKLYEAMYMGIFAAWAFYFFIALFFYFSDAFHADRRNNSMLFWKSMPKTDLEILSSKVVAGYTIMPLAIGVWIMVTGLIGFVFANVIGMLTIFYTAPGPLEALNSYMQITIAGAVYLLIALFWYAPIIGWAAFLGTLFKRWSMPLFFVIPGLAVLLERVINIRDLAYESQILKFILFRLEMIGEEPNDFDPEVWIFNPNSVSALELIQYGISQVDWLQMAIGVAMLAGFVYLASEYRRRITDA